MSRDTAPRPRAGGPEERTGKPCPVCGRPGLVAHDPFCSRRCQDVDLNRWLGGVYAIPAEDPLPESDDGER